MQAVSVEESVTEFLCRENSVVGIGGIDGEEAPSELGPAEEPLLGDVVSRGFIGASRREGAGRDEGVQGGGMADVCSSRARGTGLGHSALVLLE